MDAVTRLLADLVAIPSVNPMGRALAGPGLPRSGDDGLPRALVPRPRGRRRAAARSPRAATTSSPGYECPGAGRTILFDAHQDTVPADGMTIDPFAPGDRRRPALRPGRLRHQGGDGGDAHRLRPARPRAAAGVGVGRHGLHGRRGVHPHRLVATWRAIAARGRPGDRRRADAARHRQLPQGGGPLEGPDARASPATARRPSSAATPSTGWPGSSPPGRARRRALARRRPTRSSGRRASRSAGSRGGRASTSCPTGARSRSTAG